MNRSDIRYAIFTVSYVLLMIGALFAASAALDFRAPAAADALPSCAVEDASYGPSPCLWDADTQGNGEGTDVIVYNAGEGTGTVGVAWQGVSQDDYATCSYWDGWGEPECVVAALRTGDESLVETMIRLGY